MDAHTFLANEAYACEIHEAAHRVKESENRPVACLGCQGRDELRVGSSTMEFSTVDDEPLPGEE